MSKLGIVNDDIHIPYRFRSERTFARHVARHAKAIFGRRAIFFDLKQHMRSPSGRGSVPDGYVITLDPPGWFLVEFELLRGVPIGAAKHNHISGQLNQFISGINAPGSTAAVLQTVYRQITGSGRLERRVKRAAKGDVYGFLAGKVFANQPSIAVIIERPDLRGEVKSICGNIKGNIRVIEFETYVKKASREHFHLFDTVYDADGETKWGNGQNRGKITPQKAYRLPILASLMELGGKAPCRQVFESVRKRMESSMIARDFEVIACDEERWVSLARWEARRLKAKGYLTIGPPAGTWTITDDGRQYYLDEAAALRTK